MINIKGDDTEDYDETMKSLVEMKSIIVPQKLELDLKNGKLFHLSFQSKYH